MSKAHANYSISFGRHTCRGERVREVSPKTVKKNGKTKILFVFILFKIRQGESSWGPEIAQDSLSVILDLIEAEIELSPQPGPAEELLLRLRRRFAR